MTGRFPMHPYGTAAGTMNYVDVGSGPPIVFVHGNPSSSHEFADVIAEVRPTNRCIAPDHIGFGTSDKPTDWDYLPASHASNLAGLLDRLDLRDVTMIVGDWGGPSASRGSSTIRIGCDA